MISDRATSRRCSLCLVLIVVLFLGLVQWSFLPLLIGNGLPSSIAFLSISGGHTSKFAAPFKCLFGDPLNTCVLPSGVSLPVVAAILFHRPEEPASGRNDRFFSHRQLRAPPCV
ncbi:MAG: hypothetical protein LAO08_12290 [Acidobacteriia bacterium]|nr:hypothetical protein [Terriglobia bacterium]